MTEHVELYDKNCEFMFWLNVIKLTKFVNFFYKKKTTQSVLQSKKITIFVNSKYGTIIVSFWKENSLSTIIVDLFKKKIRKNYMEKLTILEH